MTSSQRERLLHRLPRITTPRPHKMVHLNHISLPEEEDKHLAQEMKRVHLTLAEHDDQFTTSVYGSRFAVADLPRHEMPEQEMPRDVAYRMIKDELSLDGNPMLNLASFVTTYMEEEAEKLMTESFSKNFIDYEEYPQSAVRGPCTLDMHVAFSC